MPVISQGGPPPPRKIYATRLDGFDPKKARAKLAKLHRQGCITGRDEALMQTLRELHVLSLDQVQRLLWPEAKAETARRRLSVLSARHELLGSAYRPREKMTSWGLPEAKVYALGPCGWLHLGEEITAERTTRHLQPGQVRHDLLVAELYVRMVETVRQRGEKWGLTWFGDETISFSRPDASRPDPDGLAVLGKQGDRRSLFIELDDQAKEWAQKIQSYDRFYAGDWQARPALSELPEFPFVLVVTRQEQRLLHLARMIAERRRQPIIYGLAAWDDLTASDDVLGAPAWLIVTSKGKMIGQTRGQRRALFASGEEPNREAISPAQQVARATGATGIPALASRAVYERGQVGQGIDIDVWGMGSETKPTSRE